MKQVHDNANIETGFLERMLDSAVSYVNEGIHSQEGARLLYAGTKGNQYLFAVWFFASALTRDMDSAVYSLGGYLIARDMKGHFERYI